jgi:hypothetical protein
MSAVVLPDEDDFALNPDAEKLLEEERRAAAGRLPDYNESTVAPIETKSELDLLNERDARRRAKAEENAREQAERNHATREQPAVLPQRDFHAEMQAARQQAALLETLAGEAPQRSSPADETQNVSGATDEDTDLEFFRRPQEAVAKAIASHPTMRALKDAITESYQRKTTDQLKREFPDLDATVQDPAFRTWASASPIRMQLLKDAHEHWDLEKAREVFGVWRDLRGGAAQSAKVTSAKKAVYRRSDVQRLMLENPKKYEQLADDIAQAWTEGRVR